MSRLSRKSMQKQVFKTFAMSTNNFFVNFENSASQGSFRNPKIECAYDWRSRFSIFARIFCALFLGRSFVMRNFFHRLVVGIENRRCRFPVRAMIRSDYRCRRRPPAAHHHFALIGRTLMQTITFADEEEAEASTSTDVLTCPCFFDVETRFRVLSTLSAENIVFCNAVFQTLYPSFSTYNALIFSKKLSAPCT